MGERRAAGRLPAARPAAPTPVLTVLAFLAACTAPDRPPAAPSPPAAEIFADATAEAGLDFVHFNGMTGEYSIVEEMGAGGALFDYDGDGDLDLYLVQGGLIDRGKTLADALFPPRHPPPFSDRLYRNDLESGTLAFTDVTDPSGLAAVARGYGMGLAAGDYDNDGHTDLYVTRYGPNQLLRNRGDGTFEDVTAATGSGDDRFSVPAVFFDGDGDGWLDLWVGNYVFYPADDPPACHDATGARDYCGPDVFAPQPDRFWRNRGGGTFEDVTAVSGLGAARDPALGAVVADFDGDGRLDLYVANDGHPNRLWRNAGNGSFTDDALMAGTALNADGQAEASMGVDAADFDGDGDLDLFMTHFVTETNTLFLNDGTGLFDDATTAAGLGPPSRVYTSFGTGAIDYDHDGWLDLIVVNGAVNRLEALARAGDPFPLHQPNQLFRNRGPGTDGPVTFEEVTARAGAVFELSEVSRGALFGDVDNDGDVDVVVTHNAGPARLLINELGQDRAWLGVRLMAVTVDGGRPRDVPGARAAVLSGGRPVLWRRVRIDGSYASASDPRIVFGLGDGRPVEGVRVVWPGGAVEDFEDVPPGRYTTLRRGTGTTLQPPARTIDDS